MAGEKVLELNRGLNQKHSLPSFNVKKEDLKAKREMQKEREAMIASADKYIAMLRMNNF